VQKREVWRKIFEELEELKELQQQQFWERERERQGRIFPVITFPAFRRISSATSFAPIISLQTISFATDAAHEAI